MDVDSVGVFIVAAMIVLTALTLVLSMSRPTSVDIEEGWTVCLKDGYEVPQGNRAIDVCCHQYSCMIDAKEYCGNC